MEHEGIVELSYFAARRVLGRAVNVYWVVRVYFALVLLHCLLLLDPLIVLVLVYHVFILVLQMVLV